MRRILLGSQLRRLRERSGISREHAGYHIRASESKISRLELGRVGFKRRDVEDLLTLYGVADEAERAQVLTMALEANQQGWWQPHADVIPQWFQPYIDLEESAALIRNFEPQSIPALLQTEQYARAALSARPGLPAEVVDRRVEVRMTRQRLLARPDGPRLWMVIDEAAVRRRVGGRQTTLAQLRHLTELTDHPRLTLQVTPFTAGCQAPVGGPFTLLRFPDPDLTDIVYLERLTGASYLDRREDVDEYTAAMEHLCIASLTPDRSTDMVRDIMTEL